MILIWLKGRRICTSKKLVCSLFTDRLIFFAFQHMLEISVCVVVMCTHISQCTINRWVILNPHGLPELSIMIIKVTKSFFAGSLQNFT